MERDPIGKSLENRKIKGGLVTFVVKDATSKMGKFFFNLRLKAVDCQLVDTDISSLDTENQMISIRTAELDTHSNIL